jgi:hypothetical protein
MTLKNRISKIIRDDGSAISMDLGTPESEKHLEYLRDIVERNDHDAAMEYVKFSIACGEAITDRRKGVQ